MKKACKTALYGIIKERRKTGERLIGAHTQNISHLLTVTTSHDKCA